MVFVHFEPHEKMHVKSLGVCWHAKARRWHIPAGVDPAPLTEYITHVTEYLTATHAQRDAVKALGANFDGKGWFITEKHDRTKFAAWLPLSDVMKNNIARKRQAALDLLSAKRRKPEVDDALARAETHTALLMYAHAAAACAAKDA